MPIDLAPWFYRNAVNASSGPLVQLVTRRIRGHGWEALAYLHPRLRASAPLTHSVYGICDGTGAAATRSGAAHRAISEAMERWAWAAASGDSRQRQSAGLEIDSTTTGFAAWPGLWESPARKRAYCEAVERWSLLAWWSGKIGHEPLALPVKQVVGIRLLASFQDLSVVILSGQSVSGAYVYGFAAARNSVEAAARAMVELTRNITVLDNRRSQQQGTNAEVEPQSLSERRLIHFASETGHALFKDRLARLPSDASIPTPPLLVDRRILGPWDRYCRVWRCLLEPSTPNTGELGQFLF